MNILNSLTHFSKRIRRVINARVLKRWGNTSKKQLIWDEEFSSGQWDYLEHTGDDPIYHYLEKYSNNGSILDLGCGSGNTGSEMNPKTYTSYTGVDILDTRRMSIFVQIYPRLCLGRDMT
jgi:SAM-dependent methyltransferase